MEVEGWLETAQTRGRCEDAGSCIGASNIATTVLQKRRPSLCRHVARCAASKPQWRKKTMGRGWFGIGRALQEPPVLWDTGAWA